MRVGKSGVLQCDFCGKVVVGEADILVRNGQEQHFCRGACLDQHLLEEYSDRIEDSVERRVKEEFKLLHKQVCPSCKWRLQRLL